jgi:predicted RNA polymerase sigma factor
VVLRGAGGDRVPARRPAARLDQIAALYGELSRLTGSPVVELNRAVAVAEAQGPQAALEIVDRLPLEDYHYLHATRGELLGRLGRTLEAREAYRRGLTLAHDPAERRLLQRRLAELDTAANPKNTPSMIVMSQEVGRV